MRLGFGFVETGTVTPRPQAGNPRPRLFRLHQDDAVINRMGFNNAGLDGYLVRLARRPRGPVVLGANVGINKDGADPERDYPALIAAVAPHADYAVINVSSPNTPGLRDLQGEARLRAILRAVAERVPKRPPVLVKIAPDIGDEALAALVETCVAEGVQGLIVSNTTISRPPGLRSPSAQEAGGLSGAPLFASVHRRAGTRLPAGPRPPAADRRRRRIHRRACADQNPRRRHAGAALYRLRLCGAGADPTAEARTRRSAARGRLRARAGRGGQGRTPSGRIRLMEHLSGFAPLAERYDGFILDLWGVIHDGVNAFPHAVDCLARLREAGKRTLLAVQRAAAE